MTGVSDLLKDFAELVQDPRRLCRGYIRAVNLKAMTVRVPHAVDDAFTEVARHEGVPKQALAAALFAAYVEAKGYSIKQPAEEG